MQGNPLNMQKNPNYKFAPRDIYNFLNKQIHNCKKNGITKSSYPIKKAFEGWKQGFADSESGKIKANLDVKFSERLYDKSSAHETGIFHYYTINKEGIQSDSYVHFESLWVKKNNKWLMIMEYQKSRTDKDEWDELN